MISRHCPDLRSVLWPLCINGRVKYVAVQQSSQLAGTAHNTHVLFHSMAVEQLSAVPTLHVGGGGRVHQRPRPCLSRLAHNRARQFLHANKSHCVALCI